MRAKYFSSTTTIDSEDKWVVYVEDILRITAKLIQIKGRRDHNFLN